MRMESGNKIKKKGTCKAFSVSLKEANCPRNSSVSAASALLLSLWCSNVYWRSGVCVGGILSP